MATYVDAIDHIGRTVYKRGKGLEAVKEGRLLEGDDLETLYMSFTLHFNRFTDRYFLSNNGTRENVDGEPVFLDMHEDETLDFSQKPKKR